MTQPAKKQKKKGANREDRRSGIETEMAFIEVATNLFAKRGYNGTSIGDIARELGLTNASLYYHISGKQELLLRVLAAGIAEFLDRLEDIVAKPIGPKQKLRMAIENHLDFVLNNKNAVAVFLRERRFLESPYKEQYQSRVNRYDQLFTKIVKDCMDEQVIPQGDAMIVRLAILGMVNWVVEWYQPGGRLSSEEIKTMFGDLIMERMLALETPPVLPA